MTDDNRIIESNDNDIVRSSATALVESGVTPIEVEYTPVSDLYGDETKALILHYSVHSLSVGEITEETAEKIQGTASVDLFFRLMDKAYTLITRLRTIGSSIKWIAVPCPQAVLKCTDAGERIKKITHGDLKIKGLRVLIRKSMLSDKSAVKAFMSEMGNEGIKTVIEGFGDEDFPLQDMLGYLPDSLIMTGLIDELTSKTKSAGIRALIDYGKSLQADVIAYGVNTDEEVRELRAADIFGLIPSEHYEGVFNFNGQRVTAETLLTASKGEQEV